MLVSTRIWRELEDGRRRVQRDYCKTGTKEQARARRLSVNEPNYRAYNFVTHNHKYD
jgi:hypothetical protein